MFSEYRENKIHITIKERGDNRIYTEKGVVEEKELVELIQREEEYSRHVNTQMKVVMSRGGFYIDHSF